MRFNTQRFLVVYSGVLTIALAAIVLTGATKAPQKAVFEEIDVQRINVREPDGTMRLVISNMARFPDTIEIDGEIRKHVRENAGMLFHNDEGIEIGGLVFAGKRDAEGKVTNIVHLSGDQYKQDQVLVLNQGEVDGKRFAGLTISDRPDQSLFAWMKESKRKKQELSAEEYRNWFGSQIPRRVFVGKNRERESVLELGDASNKTRIRLRVTAQGDAAIEFLDAEGKVVQAFTPETKTKRN